MNFLKWIGGFVQQTIQTNTAQEIASDIAEIYYDTKRVPGIIQLCTSLAFAGGGAALFVLEPSIDTWAKSVILQFIPVGDVVATIGAGLIGAWFGGGVGHNASKEFIKYIVSRGDQHTNADYNEIDAKIPEIIQANPHIFNPQLIQDDIEQGLQHNPLFQQLNAEQLGNLLHSLVDLIDEHKGDGTAAHQEYKDVLLAALRQLNLMPLIELLSKVDAQSAAKSFVATRSANYMAELGQHFFSNEGDQYVALGQRQAQRNERALRRRRVGRRNLGQDPESVPVEVVHAAPNPVHQNEAEHQGLEAVVMQHHPMQPVVHAGGVALKDVPMYRNMLQYTTSVIDRKHIDPRRSKRLSTRDPNFTLTPEEKVTLLNHFKLIYHRSRADQDSLGHDAQPIARMILRAPRAQ